MFQIWSKLNRYKIPFILLLVLLICFLSLFKPLLSHRFFNCLPAWCVRTSSLNHFLYHNFFSFFQKSLQLKDLSTGTAKVYALISNKEFEMALQVVYFMLFCEKYFALNSKTLAVFSNGIWGGFTLFYSQKKFVVDARCMLRGAAAFPLCNTWRTL